MQNIQALESERLFLQHRLDAERPGTLRNQLGQFATPPVLAEDIVRLALEFPSENSLIRFLDPAFGTGAFYSAFLRAVEGNHFSATGIEVDPYYGEPAQKLWKEKGLQFLLRDFAELNPPETEQEKFNLIVCNPPYVRHQHIDSNKKLFLKNRLAEGFTEEDVRLSGLAGLYCYFLLLADAWLQKDGIGIWLIPNEFMDVNYGKTIKEYLISKVELLRVHRFNPENVQFGDALVSSTVLVLKKNQPTENSNVLFSFGRTLQKPDRERIVNQNSLKSSEKWSSLYRHRRTATQNEMTLGELFTIKRGLATGDNEFFILTEKQIHERKLNGDYLFPILPSPRYLKQIIVDADKNGMPNLEQKLFLFDCNCSSEILKKTNPPYWEYVKEGMERGIPNGYICRHRTPWYSQERRPPALFVSAYIGRQSKNKSHPFRFILNRSNATVTNSYLAFYPTPLLKKVLEQLPGIDVKILEYLNSLPSEQLIDGGRVYGGGMYKLEPKEMARIGIDALAEKLQIKKNLEKQRILFDSPKMERIVS